MCVLQRLLSVRPTHMLLLIVENVDSIVYLPRPPFLQTGARSLMMCAPSSPCATQTGTTSSPHSMQSRCGCWLGNIRVCSAARSSVLCSLLVAVAASQHAVEVALLAGYSLAFERGAFTCMHLVSPCTLLCPTACSRGGAAGWTFSGFKCFLNAAHFTCMLLACSCTMLPVHVPCWGRGEELVESAQGLDMLWLDCVHFMLSHAVVCCIRCWTVALLLCACLPAGVV
jgi:hypothetical protein